MNYVLCKFETPDYLFANALPERAETVPLRRGGMSLQCSPGVFIQLRGKGGEQMSTEQAPALNAPRVVMILIAMFAAIHFIRFLMPVQWDIETLILFSFIPARYGGVEYIALPGGTAAAVWSFVTYAFLHGNVVHLIVNAVWMLALPARWRGVWAG